MFAPLPDKPDHPRLEEEILEWWDVERVFDRLREQNRGREKWSFIDGPITANNAMGVHHAWGRTLKDLFQRYKAMRGFDQRYQNGFDCQGLWVEVGVERSLGLNSKHEIEEYFTELTETEMAEYFRGNLFPNTPDILPFFLQQSGRPGFLIRAVLAAARRDLQMKISGCDVGGASLERGAVGCLDHLHPARRVETGREHTREMRRHVLDDQNRRRVRRHAGEERLDRPGPARRCAHQDEPSGVRERHRSVQRSDLRAHAGKAHRPRMTHRANPVLQFVGDIAD